MKQLIYSICVGLLVITCSSVVLVEDISERHVTVLAPTNEALLTENAITFTWESVEDAERYAIQIAKPNFAEALQIVTDSTILGLNFSKILEVGEYEWRVRAENSEYHTAYSTQSFTIE